MNTDVMQLDWLLDASIPDIQGAMEEGRLTSRDLVMFYLGRIARYDSAGVRLNSVLEVNPDAIQIAEGLDIERQQRGARGLLHGIPVLVKDNIDTADKMHTSAGSIALAANVAKEDAFLVKQLREAGAIILGKTNMTEWANFMTENMPNGYSSRGGQVLNPYGPGKFDVGGSSSGSGASIAAVFASAAVGTETSGSILSPASSNSIVGIKPTVGLISRTGVIPIAHSQDTAGPMARSVTDATVLLGVLAGVDNRDAATQTSQGRAVKNYLPYLRRDGLKGARLGIPRSIYEHLSEEWKPVMIAAIDRLKEEGAIIIDGVDIPSLAELRDYNVLLYEFKPDLNAYLSRLGPEVSVHSLADVIAYNEANADVALLHGQVILKDAESKSGRLVEAEYIDSRIRDIRLSQREGIDKVMAEHSLDALVFPANWGAGIAAKAGYPSITVPGGYTETGVPVGVTFTAKAYEEPVLIGLAYAYEQATKHRRHPVLES